MSKLRSFVKQDNNNNDIPGSNVLSLKKPVSGTWKEILNYTSSVSTTKEYQLVLNSLVKLPSEFDQRNQNYFVSEMVNRGYWAKAEIINIFSVDTQANALINWKNPGTFNPSLVNSPVFTPYAGFTGDKAGSKYVKLNFIPSINGTLIGKDNICVITGVSNPTNDVWPVVGASIASSNLYIRPYFSAGNSLIYANDTADSIIATPSPSGHFGISRGNSINFIFENNLKGNVVAASSVAAISREMYACGYNQDGVSQIGNSQVRYVFVFSYLTDSEMSEVIEIAEKYLVNYGSGFGIGNESYFYGDSITLGAYLTLASDKYVNKVSAGRSNFNFWNKGVGSTTLEKRVPINVAAGPNMVDLSLNFPKASFYQKYLFIAHGVNDMLTSFTYPNYSAANYILDYRTVLNNAIIAGWTPNKIVIVGPFWITTISESLCLPFVAAAAQIAAEYGCKYIEMFQAMKAATTGFVDAGVHPDAAAHTFIANRILTII